MTYETFLAMEIEIKQKETEPKLREWYYEEYGKYCNKYRLYHS